MMRFALDSSPDKGSLSCRRFDSNATETIRNRPAQARSVVFDTENSSAMASVDGTGVVLTDHAVVLAAVYGSAVGTFVLGLVGLMCGSTNEVQIARRAVLWVRISCTVAIIAWLCELYTEVAQPRLRRIEWPHFGLLLPPLAVAVTFIGIFVNSHPVFRWVAMLTQPLFVLCSGMASAFVFLRMQCLDSGECLARPGEALSEIEVWVSLVSYLVAGFCGI